VSDQELSNGCEGIRPVQAEVEILADLGGASQVVESKVPEDGLARTQKAGEVDGLNLDEELVRTAGA